MTDFVLPSIHRVVSGHDATGRAVVASDGPLPAVVPLAAIPGTVFHPPERPRAISAARAARAVS